MHAVDALPAGPPAESPATATDGAFGQAEQANRLADRGRRAYWTVGCTAAGIVILLIALGIFIERMSFYAPVAALNKRLAAEGLPTTWEAIQADAPHPPAELDGTAEWLAFLKAYDPFDALKPLDAFDPHDPEGSEAAAAEWIKELQALTASGKYRHAPYPTSVMVEGDYFLVVLDELSAEYTLGQFLVARAESQRARGDADGAAESLALALTLAANSKYEPLLLCRLNGTAQLRYAAEGIEPMIVGAELTPERLIQLQRALERCDVASYMDSVQLHELALHRDFATRGQINHDDFNPLDRWIARRVLIRQLDLLDRARLATALPPAERLAELAELEETYSRRSEEERPYASTAVEEFVGPDFRAESVLHELRFLEAEARRRALIAAIASRRFEQERGTLPVGWGDLVDYGVDEAPLNPWTERPMTLRRTGDDSVTIEAPWIEEALAAREARGSGDTEREPFEAITLPPRDR
ncbi:MAG TPA: hypothetical protein VGN57_03045 [Pirellulaceae bacterium]|jgi:hypothetical protein|nr:hypothetical protein [Pirellulaceae bacterium]